MGTGPIALDASDLQRRYHAVRKLTEHLVEPLSDADATVQSMPDTSPAKWHLAHTTWFWESFILRDHVDGYRAFDDNFAYLFNSYYEAEGARHARPQRGMITRPSLDEVLAYRAHVDAAIVDGFESLPGKALELAELGLNHEQQHQELLLTDIKHLFFQNPLRPAIWSAPAKTDYANVPQMEWVEGPAGLAEIGHGGGGFAFDCEGPKHQVMQQPFSIASRTVTNGEWQQFMDDGGYRQARHWLSDGWSWVQEEEVTAPLYWERSDGEGSDGGWQIFGLDGMQPLDPSSPVTHVSLYEADAYASWYGEQNGNTRLPTEAEWEIMARSLDADGGNQLDNATAISAQASAGEALSDMIGNVWEWTGSAYRPYPGFRAAEGAVGEYNGKFMSGQFVLRGGSCATPRGHCRASYRNFFYPHQRWQFTGVRLARDI